MSGHSGVFMRGERGVGRGGRGVYLFVTRARKRAG